MKAGLSRFNLPKDRLNYNAIYLSTSQYRRRWRHRAPKFTRANKAEFLARFKKLWFKKTAKKEPLVIAMCAATMGKWSLLKHIRAEDLMYGSKSLHVKNNTSGYLIKLHPVLFSVLDIYFRYHYRGRLYPFDYSTIKRAAEYRFGVPLEALEAMDINLEDISA